MISAKAAKSTAGASLRVGAASACARHRTPPADCPASAPPCPTPTQHAQISHMCKATELCPTFQRFSRSSLTCSGCVRQVNYREGDLKVQLYLAGFLCVKGIHNIEVKIVLQPQDIIVPSMQNLASETSLI